MEYSTIGRSQDISAEGVIFDKGSVYDRLHKLTDLRKAQGKRYSLVSVLMITVLAKLCGADTPTEIAEWGENHREELIKLLQLKRASMPEQSTYRRIMAHKVYLEEVERLVGEYNQ
ncbi:MAG: transposase family protein [Anaerolineales bacterium]|nr:transposase family protein [Anaerolineales bacterium]